MAKSQKKKVKDSKLNKKNVKNENTDFSNGVYTTLKIVFGVMIFLALFYLITILIVGNDSNKKKSEVEATIQYDEILAGSSFSMKDSQYLVVYYDFDDEKLEELVDAIASYRESDKLKLYTVDMGSGFNKKYLDDKASNVDVKKLEDLKINGPTLIRFRENGNVRQYIEGSDKIIEFLK